MNIVEATNTKMGSMFLSVLLGLGLAAVFRSACKDKQCIIVKGPKQEDTANYFYKIQDNCYKYTPVITECVL